MHEFAVACILNPPAPRKPGYLAEYRRMIKQHAHDEPTGSTNKRSKLGRPRTKNIVKGIYYNPELNCSHFLQENTRHLAQSVIFCLFVKISVNDHAVHRKSSESSSELEEEPPKKTQRYQLNVDHSSDSESTNPTDQIESVIQNGRSHAMDTPTGPSSTIRQKVKLFPSSQFLHLKPPPVNIQKIYKAQDANGTQSYRLGVNNISSTDIGMGHTKLITLTNDRTVQKSPTHRKNIQIIKTPTKATHTMVRQNGERTKSTVIDLPSSYQLNTSTSYPAMYNGDNGDYVLDNGHVSNGTNVDTFQAMDILSAEVVDDAICLNEQPHYQENGVNGKTNELHPIDIDVLNDDIDDIQDDEYDEQPLNGDQTHSEQIEMLNMLNNNDKTVETRASPTKQPVNHLNGGEFLLLNGSNQLKNIKYQKFVIADKPTILNGSNGSNGMKTMLNGNGSKFRLVRPFERFIKPDGSGKVASTGAFRSAQTNPSVQLLNGNVQSNRNGFIIKRLGPNGMAVRQNITVRRVNLVRLNGKKTETATESDVDETKDIDVLDSDDMDETRYKSAQDLICQLEN